jgi:Pyruvate/2-oxoacid:ferredoxin oxidoreductase delta subunit
MNISRKEFFRKGLMSLGEAVFTVTDALKTTAATHLAIPDTAGFDATPREDMVAVPHNEHCLARNSGCFACMERCEQDAIKLTPGVGVRINQILCNGCSICEYVCPVTPKALTMELRPTFPNTPEKQAEIPPEKGE